MGAPRHIRRPLEPHYGGRATGRFLNISGAQNLSGWSEFPPGHFVVADFVSLASSCRTKLAHSIAPPLQRKPASLGFALGAAFGGLFGWKISAGAGPLVRLALPNQRSHLVSSCRGDPRGRPEHGPASVRPLRKRRNRFQIRRRGGYQPPVPSPLGRFPLSGGNVPKGQKG